MKVWDKIKNKYNTIKNWLGDELRKKKIDIFEFKTHFYKIRLFFYRKFDMFNNHYTTSHVDGYELVLEDHFDGSELDKDVWKIGQSWGIIHPNQAFYYIDKECVSINTDKQKLEIINLYKPKTIIHEGIEYNPLYAHADVVAKQKFKKGIFEIRCKLPENSISNQAFWTYGAKTWPPEIDFFEFFPKHNGDGKDWKKLSMSVHWKTNWGRGSMMTNKKFKLPKSITKSYHTYTFIWDDDGVLCLFDGLPFRSVTNKRLMGEQNEQLHEFVIGNGIAEEPQKPTTNIKKDTFSIDYIKVFQKI